MWWQGRYQTWEGRKDWSKKPSEDDVERMGPWLTGAALHFLFCQEDTPEDSEARPQRPRSFQQKRDYFQKMGEGGSHLEM